MEEVCPMCPSGHGKDLICFSFAISVETETQDRSNGNISRKECKTCPKLCRIPVPCPVKGTKHQLAAKSTGFLLVSDGLLHFFYALYQRSLRLWGKGCLQPPPAHRPSSCQPFPTQLPGTNATPAGWKQTPHLCTTIQHQLSTQSPAPSATRPDKALGPWRLTAGLPDLIQSLLFSRRDVLISRKQS